VKGNKMAKPKKTEPFSLKAFVDDLLEGLFGAELSWDIVIGAVANEFWISIPIKFYGDADRKNKLRDRVADMAKRHGLLVSENRLRSDADMTLERKVGDIQGIPF